MILGGVLATTLSSRKSSKGRGRGYPGAELYFPSHCIEGRFTKPWFLYSFVDALSFVYKEQFPNKGYIVTKNSISDYSLYMLKDRPPYELVRAKVNCKTMEIESSKPVIITEGIMASDGCLTFSNLKDAVKFINK